MDRPLDDAEADELYRYEITFSVSGKRYYCFADALTKDEALGQFFRQHPNLSYSMIEDVMEV